jgi:hypothetical protein
MKEGEKGQERKALSKEERERLETLQGVASRII